jgi:hypothetical protein
MEMIGNQSRATRKDKLISKTLRQKKYVRCKRCGWVHYVKPGVDGPWWCFNCGTLGRNRFSVIGKDFLQSNASQPQTLLRPVNRARTRRVELAEARKDLIFLLAIFVMGEEEAMTWMYEPQEELKGKMPSEMLITAEGALGVLTDLLYMHEFSD